MKWLVLIACLANLGCAGITNQHSETALPSDHQSEFLSQYYSSARNGLLLRHSVRLLIPERNVDQTFSGIMRFDHDGGSIRLVGMGGFGMKLFDLSISQETVETHFISPGLNRIDNLPERIAFCVRRIWLTPQPEVGDDLCPAENSTYIYGMYNGQRIEHEYVKDTLATVRALGPREHWEIQYSGRINGTLEPSRIIFKDAQGRYSVDVSLVEQRTT